MKSFSLTLFILALGILLAITLSQVLAAFSEPSTAPPGGNTPEPINVGVATQYKTGAFGVGGVLQVPTLCIGSDCRSSWPASSVGNISAYARHCSGAPEACTVTCSSGGVITFAISGAGTNQEGLVLSCVGATTCSSQNLDIVCTKVQ